MHTLTAEDLTSQPQRLLDDAVSGELSLVTQAGEPVLLTVPLSSGNQGQAQTQALRTDLAAHLFDSDQIGLGMAASIAGVSHSAMLDELSRRQIAVVRYSAEELATELKYVDTLAGR